MYENSVGFPSIVFELMWKYVKKRPKLLKLLKWIYGLCYLSFVCYAMYLFVFHMFFK